MPEALANALLMAAFEDDAFVADRAMKLVPSLMQSDAVDESTLSTIATALADHPEQFQLIVAASLEGGRFPARNDLLGRSYAPLIKLSQEWLARGKPEEVHRATLLLSVLAPTELDDRVADLIASDDRTIRVAGLRAAIHSIEQYRKTSIEAAANRSAFRSRGGDSERWPAITPWYELPADEEQHGEESSADSEPAAEAEQPIADADDEDPFGEVGAAPEEPAPQANALEVIIGLFGDLPSDEPSPDTAPPPVAADRAESANDEGQVGDKAFEALPSKWMERWQSGNAQERPEWLTACEASAQNLIASEDPIERTWALALWLVLGHADRVDELQSALTALASNKAATAEFDRLNLLSWLPADRRLAACEERIAMLGDDGEKIVETLRQVTLIDNEQLATRIFELLDNGHLSNAKLTESLASVVIQSRIGGFAESKLLSSLSREDYDYGRTLPFRVIRSKESPSIPGRVAACDWLREQYQSAASDRQRAIALVAVSQLDHRTAVDAAIGAIDDAKADGEPVRIALSIMLGDARIPSAQRATTLLSHPSPAVRDAVLRFLATPATLLWNDEEAYVPVTYDESVLPGLWRATEQIPVDKLRALATDGEKLRQSRANLLLAAAGDRVDLAELERDLAKPNQEYATLSIAAALAKSERSDEEAIAFYRRTYEEASQDGDTGDARCAALYETLKNLPGDEAAELRRQMRKEKGSDLFNNYNDEDVFGP